MSKQIKGKVKIGLLILFTLLSVSLLLINHKDVQSSGTNYTIDSPTTWTQTVDCGTLTVNSTLTLDSSAGTPITINADSITVNSGGKISADAKGYSGGTALSNVSFIDSETTPKTVTPNGNAQISNAQSKFGGGAASFDGTGDYLSLADNADWNFGTGKFTEDFWVRFNSVASIQAFTSQYATPTSRIWWDNTTNRLYVGCNNAAGTDWTIEFYASWTPVINTWYHIAVVRDGLTSGTHYIFIDGVSQSLTLAGGAWDGEWIDISGNFFVGVTEGSTCPLNGYIDELRISKGIARWTSNFTPPTAAYTSDSYTKLLLHMNGCTDGSGTGAGIGGAAFSSTYFKDSEDIAKTLTANGSAQLSPLQGKFGGSSVYLDGSGDFVTAGAADNADFDFGTGDFTIDTWIYPIDKVNCSPYCNEYIVANTLATSVGPWLIGRYSNGQIAAGFNNGGTSVWLNSGGTTAPANQWSHIAVVRSNGSATLYVNGTSVYGPTAVGDLNISSSGRIVRVGSYGQNEDYQGYIDELRISKGIARWTSNFTPPTAPYTSDSYTKLLMHADGSGAGGAAYVVAGGNGASSSGAGFSSTTFVDSETTPKNVTAYGNAQITNAQSKFGAVSAYFDGTGDYLSLADSDDWSFGTGDFTVDFWVNFSSTTGAQELLMRDINSGGENNQRSIMIEKNANHTIHAMVNDAGVGGSWFGECTSTGTVSANTWYHIAYVRQGSNFYLFINGTNDGTASSASSVYNASSDILIGVYHDSGGYIQYFNGYLDELRISKGVARWTANFTPPGAPYTSDSYTKLLLHADGGVGNSVSGTGGTTTYGSATEPITLGSGGGGAGFSSTTFIDSATTPKIVTANGDAKITNTQSKFGAVSAYFPGTESYLSVADSDDWNFGTGDFTIDVWMNPAHWASGSYQNIASNYGDSSNWWSLYTFFPDKRFRFVNMVNGTAKTLLTDAHNLTDNTWHHIALVRSSGNFIWFIDGISINITNDIGTDSIVNPSAPLNIGYGTESVGNYLNGYLDEFRISKGIARWTENFTPPTAPYTSDSYTKLLLHMGGGQGAGGAGAGAMKLVVAGTLTNDGTISANGADGVVGGGGGSGGSIWAICNTLAGSGSFSANGGSGGGAGGAGSGGRIRLSPSAANTFSGTTTMSAGTGYVTSSSAATASGTLSSAKITTASVVAGATSNTTINFTTVSAVPTNGTIEVDFPSGYDLSGTLAYVSNTGVTGSNITLSVINTNTLVITLGSGTSISANTAVSIVVSGIKNPNLLGSTGTFTIRTKTAAGAIIDQVVGTSLAVDKITVPTLTISSPNGSESWAVGSSHNITWTYNGTISNNLSLYYATDGGTAYSTIANGLSNSGTYSWTVPAVPAPGTTNKVKIQDTYYQTLTDTQNTDFNSGTLYQTLISGTGGSGSVVLDKGEGIYYKLGTYTGFSGQYYMAFDPYTNSVWAVNGSPMTVNKLRSTDGVRIGTYNTGYMPEYITFEPITNSMWVPANGVITKYRTTDGVSVDYYSGFSGQQPTCIAFDSSTNSLWATNYTANKVRKFNPANPNSYTDYNTGANPIHAAFDPVNKLIWVANYTDSTLSKIQASDGANLGTYTTGSNPRWVAFDSLTNSVWVANSGTNGVRKFNASDPSVYNDYLSGLLVWSITFDPLNNCLWADINNQGYYYGISRINPTNGTQLDTDLYLPEDNAPTQIVFDSYTKSIWVGGVSTSTVRKIKSLLPTDRFEYSSGLSSLQAIAFDSLTNSVWVTGETNAVVKIRVSDGANLGTYAVGAYPWGIAFDPYTNSIWVTNWLDNNISKLSATSGAHLADYTAGARPWGIAFDSSTNSMWVANYDSAKVSKLRPTDGVNIGTYTVGTNPVGLAFDSVTNSIWVANTGSNNVSKLRASDGTNLSTYTTDAGPNRLSFDSSTGSLWVVNNTSVNKFRVTDGLRTDYSGAVAGGGDGIVFVPLTNTIWLHSNDWGLQVRDASDSTVVRNFANAGKALVFEPVTSSVWGVNPTSGAVCKFPATSYFSNGTFTSRAIDIGASNTLSALNYTATLPTNTTLKFQVAANNDNSTWSFVGTDGTANTYFATSGTAIPTGIASSQYLKYKAFLTTIDPVATPILSDVSIGFSSTNSSYNTISDASDANFTITSASVGGSASVVPASLVVGVTGNVTVAFTSVNTIPADGKIVVTFPAGFTLPSTGNYTATSSTIGGTLTPTTSSQTITITRSGGSSVAAGAQSIILSNIQNPIDTCTTGTYSLQTQNSSNYVLDSATVAGSAITNGGTLPYTSVVPASLFTSAVGNVTASFVTANPIPANGKILITFPSGYTLSSGGTTVATSTTINGTLDTTLDLGNRIVTITRNGGGATQTSAGAHNITLTYIKNPTTGGTTNTYTIQTNTSSSDTSTGKIDYNNAVAASFINGYLSSASIAHVSYIAGATSNTTIAFTTVNAISANGTIEVDFPSGYDLSGTLAYVSNTGVTGTSITPSVTNGNTLIITLGANTSISANTPVSIVISGIKNPSLLGSTGTYTIRTKSSAGALIDQLTEVTAQTIAVPTLTISSPNGAEDWAVGSSHNITWTYNGTISNNLSLYYATDGGTAYNSIANGLSNSGTYSWIVPAVPAPGTTNKVKIQDTFYQILKDSSSAEFTGGALFQTAATGTGGAGSVTIAMDTSSAIKLYSDFTSPNNMAFDTVTNSMWVAVSGAVVKVRPTDGVKLNTYTDFSGPWGIAFDPVNNAMWVSNNSSTTVSKFRPTDGVKISTSTLSSAPGHVVFDSSTNSIWVTVSGGVVAKLSCTDGHTISTTSTVSPYGICFDSYTNSIWLAQYTPGYVNKVRCSDGSLVGTFTCNYGAGNTGPRSVALNPVTNSIWVGVWYGSVETVNPDTLAQTGTVGGINRVNWLSFDPLSNSMWLGSNNTDQVPCPVGKYRASDNQLMFYYNSGSGYSGRVPYMAFDPVTGSMWIDSVNTNNSNSIRRFRAIDTALVGTYTDGTSNNPMPIYTFFDSVSNSIWAGYTSRGSVTKVRITDGAITNVTLGSNPAGIALNPYTNSLWVANSGSNPGTISKLRPTDNVVIGTYTVGTGLPPYGIIYESCTNSMWVTTKTSGGTVIKIRASDGSILGTYTAGAYPWRLAFDSCTNSIWVSNSNFDYYYRTAGGTTVSKLSVTDGHNISTSTVGTSPLGLCFDPVNNAMWVANYDTSNLSKLSCANGTNLGTYSYGGTDVIFDSVTNSIWALYGSTLYKHSVVDGTVTGGYPTNASYPYSLALDPVTNSIWVTVQWFSSANINGIQKFSPIAPYYINGNFTSRAIDVGASNTLNTISYNISTPANTTLQFQVAGSTDGTNFSSFIGSGNSTSTYLTSGSSIPSSLTSDRYLKYKAFFTTSDAAVTPTLSDASISFTSGTSSEMTIADASDANFTITSASVGGTASVTPASLVVGVTGNVTVAFTNVNAIPADGKIVVTFPSGFTLPSTGNYTATSSTIGGTLTPTTSSQTITITRSGGSSVAAGAQSITLSNIQNPSVTGTTGTYSLQTQSSAGYIIDSASNIAGSTIVAVPLTLTSPDPAASQTFKAGTSQTITWTSAAASCPSAVNLKYSTDSGATYSNVIATAVANTTGSNSYIWTVPGATGAHARIKVEDANNTQIFDTSDVDLTIAYPAITIISPNGGESWTVGSTHNITWTTDSSAITAVKLEYSTDGGTTWNLITASAPNTGTYAWTLSGLFVTDQLKIRATGLAGISSLSLSGTAASKMSGVAYLESNKTLFMDVLSDFSAGDTLVISGHKFSNFTVSDPSHLWLDLYNNGASDAKIIQVSASSPVFAGGSGDGWAYAERALATF